MGRYGRIADKFRRALRNGTGAQFSLEELRAMAEAGLMHKLAKIEVDTMIAEWAGERPHPREEQ